MELAVVWQNPEPLIRAKHTVQRIRDDQSFVVYLVTNFEETQEFTLISGVKSHESAAESPTSSGRELRRLHEIQ